MAFQNDPTYPAYDWTASSDSHSWHPALRPDRIESQRSASQLELSAPTQSSEEQVQSAESILTANEDVVLDLTQTVQGHKAAPKRSPKDETQNSRETLQDTPQPQEHYEYQAEVLDLPHAQVEGAGLSLIEDEQPLPVTASVQDSALISELVVTDISRPPPIDRTFTDDFAEPRPDQAEEHAGDAASSAQARTSVQWPSAGDDRTFAELLGDDNPIPIQAQSKEPLHRHGESLFSQDWSHHEDSTSEQLVGDDTTPAPPVQNSMDHVIEHAASQSHDAMLEDEDMEDDLAAAFQAALDLGDEDLLETPQDDLDPSTFFDDDDGLLDDDDFLGDDTFLAPIQSAASTTARYTPVNAMTGQTSAPNPYAPPAAPITPQTLGRAAGTPDTGLYDVYNQSTVPTPAQPSGRPAASHAQSFADKAKGGYQSPYDLPMEVVKTRRRPPPQATSSATPAPPPRSSSSLGGSQDFSQQFTAAVPSHSSQAPPLREAASVPPMPSSAMPNARSSQTEASGFFAELPVSAKSRSRPPAAATPPLGGPTPQAFPSVVGQAVPSRPYQPQVSASAAAQYRSTPPAATASGQQPNTFGLGLRQPDRMPLLPEMPSVEPQAPEPPSVNVQRYSPQSQVVSSAAPSTRYSPAPGSQAAQGPTRSRYAAAPAAGPAHQFAPRTSSPLAYQKSQPIITSNPHPELVQRETVSPPLANVESIARSSPPRQSSTSSRYAPSSAGQVQTASQRPAPIQRPQSFSAAAGQPNPTRGYSSFSVQHQQTPGPALPHRRAMSREISFAAPQDERAHDPLQRWKGSPLFSWHDAGSVLYTFPKHTPVYAGHQAGQNLRPSPGAIHTVRAEQLLPLEDRNSKFPGPLSARAKGKKKEIVPWLAAKVADLETSLQTSKDDFSISPDLRKRGEERVMLWKLVKILVEHDGVLEGVNTKVPELVRDLLLPDLAQLSAVSDLQTPTSASIATEVVDRVAVLQLRAALLEGQRERAVWLAEEKKLWGHAMLIASTMGPSTWKQIVQSFVRSQVKTVGSDTRSLAYLYQVFGGNSDECIDELVPASARAGFQMMSKDQSGAIRDPLEGLDQWRETLALIVSNRTANDGPSIIALGKLLADYGRVEAAHICYLFARSLLKHSGPDSPDAHLVLLGASPQDSNFGHDLDSILLTEIYEWASSLSAPTTTPPYIPHFQSFKLMHAQMLTTHGLKTKAQAYCDHITTAFTSTTKPSPYYHPTFTQSVGELSAFLQQTYAGKGGLFSKPSMNKVSSGAASWFTKFVSGEDDQEGSQSGPGSEAGGTFGGVQETPPISRSGSSADLYNPMMAGFPPGATHPPGQPSIQPMTGPLGAPYHSSSAQGRYAPANAVPQTVPQTPSSRATNEANQAAGRYAPNHSTPLSNQTSSSALSLASTPDGSTNNTSSAEQYQPQPRSYSPAQLMHAGSSSRYAPSNYASATSQSQLLAAQLQHSTGWTASRQDSYQPGHTVVGAQLATPEQASQPPNIASIPAMTSFTQTHIEAREHQSQNSTSSSAYLDRHAADDHGNSNTFVAPSATNGYQPYQPPGRTEDLSTLAYAPPSNGEYQAPPTTYQPYEPDDETAQNTETQRNKSMLDDDDDDDELLKRAEALKKQQNSQADREADDAFRKAAEADAARDKGGDKKAGWLGGWFGGKKEKDATPGPIRAKLGEESSFYYDEQLKKWVNKKGGSESSTPAAPTPPPPRGPPSRIVSAASMGPPSGPPSRVASAGSVPPMRLPTSNPSVPGSGPPSRSGTPASHNMLPPAVNGNASGPPTRPSTGLSNATDLDDILGGPPGSKKAGGTIRGKKKGGRYVDVMAK